MGRRLYEVEVFGPGNVAQDAVLRRRFEAEDRFDARATGREEAAKEFGGDPDDYHAFATEIRSKS